MGTDGQLLKLSWRCSQPGESINMRLLDMRFLRYLVPIFILFLSAIGHAAAQDYPGFPYTIMRRSPRTRRPLTVASKCPGERRVRRHRVRRTIAVARGSSGSVLPTPLPRTPLIPPEGGGAAVVRVAPQQQGTDRRAGPRQSRAQSAARRRDLSGPRLTLRHAAGPLWRARWRQRAIHGCLPPIDRGRCASSRAF